MASGNRHDGVCLENSTDDEEHDAHSHGRDEQRRLTTKTVDHEEHEDGGRYHFDDTVDPRGKEGVRCSGIPNLRYSKD